MSEALQKNILAIKQHSEQTRVLFRELEAKNAIIDTLMGRMDALTAQVQALQVKMYTGGPT